MVGWLIRFLGMTLRVGVVGEVERWRRWPEPLIYVVWHNRIAVLPYLWRRSFPRREAVVLTSASKDGAVLGSAVGVFRMGAVRGSSSRRGAAAMVGLRRAAREGKDLAFTPDGPRGPQYVMQGGVVKMAQATGLVVVPISVEYERCWRLRTWDEFRIPKPFSKVRVVFGEGVKVRRDLTAEEFEEEREKLEERLRAGLKDDRESHGENH